jgi:bifunctional hydroxylase/dehydrase
MWCVQVARASRPFPFLFSVFPTPRVAATPERITIHKERFMDAAVIVVGAGPAGLMLAAELRLADVDVVVVDRLPAPTGESRGLGFTARTMEVFDQRGLLSRFGDIETSPLGHFGGLPVDFSVLDGAHFGAKGIPQARTEAVLAAWATELGADIRRGWELVALNDRGDHVEAELATPEGPVTLNAARLVGCDGGRSTVRKLAGFAFPGTAATMEMFLADLRDCETKARVIGETVPGGMVMSGPIGDGITRIIACERGRPAQRRTAPPEFAEIADSWERLTGEHVHDASPVWLSAFGDATRQATEYRRGRVLLAGDAAHIHLPAGGQGMNTSIQDAVNLGWKLAAETAGWAPPGLLDSYHAERHPVGARLLVNTQAQGMLFLSGDEVEPLRDVMRELIRHPEVGRHLAGMVSGLDIAYDMGGADHPLLGRRMPRVELVTANGRTSTAELLRDARGLVLDLGDDPELRATAADWADRVTTVTAKPHTDGLPADVHAVLIRPDGHIAWIAPHADPLENALERWFGAPRPSDEE